MPERKCPECGCCCDVGRECCRMCEGPDEETQTTPAAASGAALESLHAQSVLPQNAPAQDIAVDAPSAQAFDYSGLDDQTVADLHLAEREYSSGKKMAEMGLRRMADAVAIAHDALCGWVATICRKLITTSTVKTLSAHGAKASASIERQPSGSCRSPS